MDTQLKFKDVTITLIKRNKDGIPVEKTICYPDGREITETLT